MTLRMTMLAGSAICALATAAQADCAEDLARLTGDHGMDGASASANAGIAKDGSLAPLEQPDAAANSSDTTGMSADAADDPASSGADMAGATSSMTNDGGIAPADGSATDMASETGETAADDMDSGGETMDTAATSDTSTPAGEDAADDMTADGAAADTDNAEGISKDGSLAPLEGDGGTSVAMSGQDAANQQDGEPTAAQTAHAADADAETGVTGSASADRHALIEEARAALSAGDEEACRAAVEQAQAL